MTETVLDALQRVRVVPLVQSDSISDAIKTSEALLEGGLDVLEVVLRTEAAMESLGALIKEFPNAKIGAGTVLTPDQAKKVLDMGSDFVVSPGLTPEIVTLCQKANIPVLPGIATPSELQLAWNLGLKAVKFFPAGLAGGPKMLKAFSSVFQGVRFMPTGGVNAETLKDYLAIPAVIACGGSWLTPKEAIASGDFAAITKLAKEARALAVQ